MKNTELRIGNYISLDYPISEDSKLTIVGILHINEISKGQSKFKPIPLTEEWLLKFGFKKYHSNLFVNEGYLSVNWCMLHEYYFVSFNHKRVELKYVHQLQNLYFALTGEELNFKQ